MVDIEKFLLIHLLEKCVFNELVFCFCIFGKKIKSKCLKASISGIFEFFDTKILCFDCTRCSSQV